MPLIQHSSETNEHYTPVYISGMARHVMGAIDLDPASNSVANQLVQATKIYAREDNGYPQNWSGRVFLNPPGGSCDAMGRTVRRECEAHGPECRERGHRRIWVCEDESCPCRAEDHTEVKSAAGRWWSKLLYEYETRRVTEAVFVGFSLQILQTTQTGGQRTPLDFPCCYPRSRVAYLHPDLSPSTAPPQASVITYLPPGGRWAMGAAKFHLEFSALGKVVIPT